MQYNSTKANSKTRAGAMMSASDWDRLWSRDLLHWLKKNNREEIWTRQRYVDYVLGLLGEVGCRKHSSVELGCGTGLVTRGLYEQHGLASGMLVDYSTRAIELASVNAHGRNIRVVQADVLTWQTDERFDLAFSIGLLEHYEGSALLAMVRKHADLLKPGGHALMIVPRKSLLWPAVAFINHLQGIRETPLRRRLLTLLCERAGLVVKRRQNFIGGLLVGILAQKPAKT